MTEHYLYDFAVLVSGIIIAAFASLVIQRDMKKRDEKDVINNVKNAIKQEIQGNLDTLKEEDLSTDKDGNWATIAVRILTVNSFESSVQSGKFILLSDELRKRISEVYTDIHIANNYTDQLQVSANTITKDAGNKHTVIQSLLQNLKDKHDVIENKSESLLEESLKDSIKEK
jgi:hypothetical protein